MNEHEITPGPRWLRAAPKAILAATVVLVDLGASYGLMVHQREPASPSATVDALTCEHGSCTRMSPGASQAEAAVPTGKPRLLEFTSKHCPSCARVAPVVQKLERECTAHDGTILPIDVDSETGDSLANRYSVNDLPTFIMIDANGAEVSRLVGEQPRQRLAVALADVSGVVCQVL